MSFYVSRLICQRIIIVCAFALAASSAFATELTVVTEELPPLDYADHGVATGYSTELIEAVLREAKIKSTVNILPWARAYQMATTQPNTLIFSTTRNADREELFEWIGPISSRQIYLYKLKSRTDIEVKTVADSFHYKIGLVREMASGKTFLKNNNVPDTAIDYAPTAESNLKKLLVGRIDLIISLDWSAAYQMKKEKRNPNELEPVLVLDDKSSYYFALNKQSDPVLVRKIRKAFEKVKQSGLMDRLRNKYMH
ncbi:substrate-binding periplasmic protein [Undibacterium sp. Dicai25W]|uniref:substrate-binding periplasmic protein n=1 Tax=Undibacterium sp. Dicai25W TaxID=3413034 RepID=UPI003BF4346F